MFKGKTILSLLIMLIMLIVGFLIIENQIKQKDQNETVSENSNVQIEYHLSLPESTKVIKIIDSNPLRVITDYEDKEERGVAIFETGKRISLPYLKQANGSDYQLIPFAISNQGSAIFWYIGLFKNQPDSPYIYQHLNSKFLADRIKNLTCSDETYSVRVYYDDFASDQSYTEEPSVHITREFAVTVDGLKQEYKSMHKSWDKNNDGINDCEDDGTCDDSVDYSIPRKDIK